VFDCCSSLGRCLLLGIMAICAMTLAGAFAAPRVDAQSSETIEAETQPAEPLGRADAVPIPQDANATAWRREVWLIGMMFVMGIGCTAFAAFAFWMLSKNSASHDR